jgi:4-hydroxy-tetrahydrodipicolinate reductase
MKYGLIGSSGRLGSEVKVVFNQAKHLLVYSVDIEGEKSEGKPDIIVDCSLPEALSKTTELVDNFNIPLVIATTGLSEKDFSNLKKLSQKTPVVQSYSFSIGIQILLQLTKAAKEKLPDWDVEISETHHRFKKDKPSGTAKMIQSALSRFEGKQINTTSLRLGNVTGDHTVSFGGLGEVLSISHRALSRRTFAEGILLSAEFALKKSNGFYSFSDVVFEKK